MNWKIRFLKAFTILTIITLFCMKSNAQKINEVSDEVKRLQEQVAIIKLEKEISEYQKAIFENSIAQQKVFDVTPPKGEVSTTGEHIEAKLLSSKALSLAMSEMVVKLNNTINPKLDAGNAGNRITLIYYDKNQLNKVNEYKALIEELTQQTKDIETHVIEVKDILKVGALSYGGGGLSIMEAAISAAGVLNAIAGIASYFKTDVTYATFKAEYDDCDLISSFFQTISSKGNNIDFYAPNLYPIVSSIGVENTPLSNRIKGLNNLKSKIEGLITDLDRKTNELKASLKDEKDKNEIEKLNKALKLVENAKNTINTDKTSIEAIFKALYVQSDGKSNLSNILSVEALYVLLSKEKSYVILLKATGTGGTLYRKGLFVDNHLEHSGGVTLNCIVFNRESKVVFTGVETGHFPYSKVTKDTFK